MTLIGRSNDEWVGANNDAKIPPRVRLRVFDRAKGRCEACTRKLHPGDRWQADHVQALINGGANREGNLQLLCDWCHKGKTAQDSGEKARTYAKRRSNAGIKKPRTLRQWRKFDGTPVNAPRER